MNMLCLFGHDFKWDRVYDGFSFAEALVCRSCGYCPSQPLGPPIASRSVSVRKEPGADGLEWSADQGRSWQPFRESR